MHELLKKQECLHKEATEVLNTLLTPILSKYGDVVVGGSYSYELMTYPDIDIDVVNTNVSKEMYADLCAEFLKLKEVSKLQTTNRVEYKSKRAGSQKGYWISPKIHINNIEWTIDIWLQAPEWNTGNTTKYSDELKNISDEQKVAILSIKDLLMSQKEYGVGKKYQSVDVYEAVLDKAVLTIEQFKEL